MHIRRIISLILFFMEKKFKTQAPRTDKKKNVWKVAEILANNPHKTARELAKETWLWTSTANRARQELAQSGTKDDTIQYIVWKSKERIKRSQRIFDRYLDEVEAKEKLDRADIQVTKDIVKDDLQRVTVLGWDVTDEQWWLKNRDPNDLSIEELLQIIRKWQR